MVTKRAYGQNQSASDRRTAALQDLVNYFGAKRQVPGAFEIVVELDEPEVTTDTFMMLTWAR